MGISASNSREFKDSSSPSSNTIKYSSPHMVTGMYNSANRLISNVPGHRIVYNINNGKAFYENKEDSKDVKSWANAYGLTALYDKEYFWRYKRQI